MENQSYCPKNTMEKAASRARGDRLQFMYEICEKQKTVGTVKLEGFLNYLHESDKLDAIHFRDLALLTKKQSDRINELEQLIAAIADDHSAVPDWIRQSAKSMLANAAKGE